MPSSFANVQQRSARPGLRWLRGVGRAVVAGVGLLYAAWAVWGLHLQGPMGSTWLAIALAAAWLLLVWRWCRCGTAMGLGAWCTVALLVVLHSLWWAGLQPRADRDWADDVARQTRVQPQTPRPGWVHMTDVRNFHWRSDTDYTARWEPRSYDLSTLRSVDVALSYWMGPAIAHTLVSFGFTDGQQLVFSIEIRKERHEQFDAIAGFFKQYEMTLVAADERDILAVRTGVRGEQVHLYRLHMAPPAMRALLMAYAEQANALQQTPRFYHTLTANCTTIVWELARRIGVALPIDARLLASGYLPSYLQHVGALASPAPLAQQRSAGDITAYAAAWRPDPAMSDAQASADFSHHIRQGMNALPR